MPLSYLIQASCVSKPKYSLHSHNTDQGRRVISIYTSLKWACMDAKLN